MKWRDAKKDIEISVRSVDITTVVSASLEDLVSSTTQNWCAMFIFRTDCAYKENAPKDILGIVGIGQANPKAVHETKSASIYIWN